MPKKEDIEGKGVRMKPNWLSDTVRSELKR